MRHRIIDISENHVHLRSYRGFLVLTRTQAGVTHELGRVALSDISAVIAHAYGITYSNTILVAFAEHGIIFTVCDRHHQPISQLLPLAGHQSMAARFEAQLLVTQPQKKRLWAALVKAKISQQAALLDALGRDARPVLALVGRVQSGDVTNVEATAARLYWGLLFPSVGDVQGEEDGKADGRFKRQGYNAHPPYVAANLFLNYGYTVLRSAMARAVCSAGLHPALGLFHRHELNPMRLVDDLMEVFRPLVDFRALSLLDTARASGQDFTTHAQAQACLTPAAKRVLANVLDHAVVMPYGKSPAALAMQRLASSLAQVYLKEKTELLLPLAANVYSANGYAANRAANAPPLVDSTPFDDEPSDDYFEL
jgi:CRISPR-associated protein Cas1